MSIFLGEQTWPEVKMAIEKGAVSVVPVGSTEQHGPHLPLETDWRLCSSIAERACRRVEQEGIPVVLTPPVWMGFAGHHMDFPGTITLDVATFTQLIGQVAKSLWHHGFRKILLLNGHGGNANLLRAAVQQLRFEHGVKLATASYWDFVLPFIAKWRQSAPGGIDHSCEMETALMLAVRPELVQMDKAEDHTWFPHSKFLTGDLAIGAPVTVAWNVAELSANGIVGDPTRSTGRRGEEFLDAVTQEVAEFIRDFYSWDWDKPLNI